MEVLHVKAGRVSTPFPSPVIGDRPVTPGIVWWSFFCDGPTGYCGGVRAISTYGPAGGSSGGKAELWRYRRP